MKSKPILIGLKLILITENGLTLNNRPYTRDGIRIPLLSYLPEELDSSKLSETQAVILR